MMRILAPRLRRFAFLQFPSDSCDSLQEGRAFRGKIRV